MMSWMPTSRTSSPRGTEGLGARDQLPCPPALNIAVSRERSFIYELVDFNLGLTHGTFVLLEGKITLVL
jgi:hypothetical protein